MGDTLRMVRAEVKAVGSGAEIREVVADKEYHSNETILELKEQGLRGYLSKTDRGRRGRRLQRQRSELVERPFAHQFTKGGLRRIFVRGHANMRKRLLTYGLIAVRGAASPAPS